MVSEPFTYWDWQGYAEHDEDVQTRRLLWEREKSFSEVAGHKFPTSRERWEAFKSHVNSGLYDARFTKKIAMARWMRKDDLQW